MTIRNDVVRRLLWVTLFGVAFAFVESTVVVYLRALYYPEGFHFPLKMVNQPHLVTEVAREAATIVMLTVVALLAGSKNWERFGYFLLGFGVWDLFYYVWLKVILDWPQSIMDWDILFLIPLPWIAPVIAPVLVALLMVVCGATLVIRLSAGKYFRPSLLSWLLFVGATIVLTYSFMSDFASAIQGQMPVGYHYELLVAALLSYTTGFVRACATTSPISRTR